jgi:hypothetical protein
VVNLAERGSGAGRRMSFVLPVVTAKRIGNDSPNASLIAPWLSKERAGISLVGSGLFKFPDQRFADKRHYVN